MLTAPVREEFLKMKGLPEGWSVKANMADPWEVWPGDDQTNS